MSKLTEVYFNAYRSGGGGSPQYHIPSHEKAIRAVAEAAVAEHEAAIAAASAARAEPVDDPCQGCKKGSVCRTPKCGRLSLPHDHPFRSAPPAPPAAPVVPECNVCEPQGIIDDEGNGPWDCYACGKKVQHAHAEFEKWWKAVSNDEHVPIGIEDRHVARLAWSAAIAAIPDKQ